MGSGSRRALEVGRSQTGTLQARSAEDKRSQAGTLQAHTPITGSDGFAMSTFHPPLEYSTDKVVLFWQPVSFFSQLFPSSFVVAQVSYSYGEHFIIVEKARLSNDHRAVELIMSWSDPQHSQTRRSRRTRL